MQSNDIDPASEDLADVLGFDPSEIRDRYAVERGKRLAGNDGAIGFRHADGNLSGLLADPRSSAGGRAPLNDAVDVAIVGGGLAGLVIAAKLRQAGVGRIRIIDTAADFGGTWYWNRYPGVACDIESYIYMPLLEEVGYIPKYKYAPGEEIYEHARAIGRTFGLYEDACFRTSVTEMRWDDLSKRWVIETDVGDVMRAQFVCSATGPYSTPRLPDIPGIEGFKGRLFHTSRWDYEYTHGWDSGEMTGLADKVVGVIGTGATGVQCVPHLAKWAKELYVFQRTPASVDVRANRETDADWAAALKPGWQQERIDNFNAICNGIEVDGDLVNDGWTENIGKLLVGKGAEEYRSLGLTPEALTEIADMAKMEQVRARVDRLVADKATAEALKPYFRQFCKRPCFHDEYLDAFNRPNVSLVDTKGQGVTRVTETGVVANGREYNLDCLILATGFDVGTNASRFTQRSGFEIHGVGGVKLSESWADGARTFHGLHVHGFPNFFIASLLQSAWTVNYNYLITIQADQIAHIVKTCNGNGIEAVEVEKKYEDKWVEEVLEKTALNYDFMVACTPGYFNNEGKIGPRAAQDGFYGKGNIDFSEQLKSWRDGNLEGLTILKKKDAFGSDDQCDGFNKGACDG